MMMIDWLKEETTWHLDICMYNIDDELQKRKRTQLYLCACAVISTNDNSSQRILVNYEFILARSHPSLSLLSWLNEKNKKEEEEEEKRYFSFSITLTFLHSYIYTHVPIQMLIFNKLTIVKIKLYFPPNYKSLWDMFRK
jgi:hypothetical protein